MDTQHGLFVPLNETLTGNIMKPRVPDVCDAMNIRWLNLIGFVTERGWHLVKVSWTSCVQAVIVSYLLLSSKYDTGHGLGGESGLILRLADNLPGQVARVWLADYNSRWLVGVATSPMDVQVADRCACPWDLRIGVDPGPGRG